MKAIILAAGYATRLYPLTENMPKALLEIGGRPIIDYIVGEINKVSEVSDIYVVTNHKFADHFFDWAKKTKSSSPITVIDDGTLNEGTRLGAIGDIKYVIDKMNIDDDIMVIAGDNYFTYSLKDYYNFYKGKNSDTICVKPFPNEAELNRFGIALISEDNRVLNIEEKPKNPKSNLVVYAAYMYKKDTIPLFEKYLKEGNNPDAPGHFVVWLYGKKPVYAYSFKEECYDIGTLESYETVKALFPQGDKK
ncbi:MAG: nucleotidyltransferase family protein [Lachnospiraceae bacterium]|nr:nucleotidyltransferase family protein [Lachnospiraceae bacterium]